MVGKRHSFSIGHRKYNNCLLLRRAEKALETSLNMAFLVPYFCRSCQDYRSLMPLFCFVFYMSGLNKSDYYMQKTLLLPLPPPAPPMGKLSLVFLCLAEIVLFCGGNHKSGWKGKDILTQLFSPFSKE